MVSSSGKGIVLHKSHALSLRLLGLVLRKDTAFPDFIGQPSSGKKGLNAT